MRFNKLTEEAWNEEMAKYKELYPNNNNKYEDRLVTISKSFNCESDIVKIKEQIKYIMNRIESKNFDEGMIIEKIEFDIDKDCNIFFVDVTFIPNITENSFKSALKLFDANL